MVSDISQMEIYATSADSIRPKEYNILDIKSIIVLYNIYIYMIMLCAMAITDTMSYSLASKQQMATGGGGGGGGLESVVPSL